MNEMDKLFFHDFRDVVGKSYDYIVIGGGAYGTSFAHRMLQKDKKAKILVLDKGSYLIPDHIQNIPPSYVTLNSTTGIRPWKYTGTKGYNFMPQIPYLGGRALYWNAWIPQPDESEMPDWPEAAIADLRSQWYDTGQFMGRRYSLETPGNANQSLATLMQNRLFAGLQNIEMATPQGNPAALASSMATGQDVGQEQFAKFSPISVLVQDAQSFPKKLTVAVNTEVDSFVAAKDKITTIKTNQGDLDVGKATIVLACNTLEAAFILTRSFPEDPLIGKNLSGHIRSFLPVRLPAKKVPGLTDNLQATALYMPGRDPETGRFMHTHVSVVHNPKPADSFDLLYQILPDASSVAAVETYQDPDYVVIMLHSMGEALGKMSADSQNYVSVTKDGEGLVNVELEKTDETFWNNMDKASYQVIEALVGDAMDHVEYQHSETIKDPKTGKEKTHITWRKAKPKNIRNEGMVHESGTLWMGEDPQTSVTDPKGRMHRFKNTYGLGSMLFPRPGSWNPTLTGVAQAFALVDHLTET